jgi:hypothetical protein
MYYELQKRCRRILFNSGPLIFPGFCPTSFGYAAETKTRNISTEDEEMENLPAFGKDWRSNKKTKENEVVIILNKQNGSPEKAIWKKSSTEFVDSFNLPGVTTWERKLVAFFQKTRLVVSYGCTEG